MNRSTRGLNAVLAAACALMVAAVIAVPAGAATVVHFQQEGVQAYVVQLHKGEVHALTFHPGTTTGHLHISMDNGKHYTVAYASSEQGKLVAEAQAGHARVQIAAVQVKKTAPVKHKLRYIAGGILILVIIVVLIVLLIGRRRALAEEDPRAPGESTAP
ncbi:MAG TPA: hypothetical protein VK730_05620 [Solirubrobacteraceae bacterium]|nr:hypothetical protein [Solirubrobacteraceae bacterium]